MASDNLNNEMFSTKTAQDSYRFIFSVERVILLSFKLSPTCENCYVDNFEFIFSVKIKLTITIISWSVTEYKNVSKKKII